MSADPLPTDDIRCVSSTNIRELADHLRLGGIGVLRSDTVPAAACRAFSEPTVRQLDLLLDHAAVPYSVNFFDSESAERWLEPSAADLRILDAHAPGRITLVSQVVSHPAARRLSAGLHADGQTLGVRVSSSNEEAHLAKLIGGPVVTASITINGRPAETVEEAGEYLLQRMDALRVAQRIMTFRDRSHRANTDLSTVVRTRKDGRWSVPEIIRAGAVSEVLIRRSVSTPWTPREVQDVT
jgi:tRNA A37 threonylcarbamoyladenosine synthetase subunit TsaC/SUA5/YrdC